MLLFLCFTLINAFSYECEPTKWGCDNMNQSPINIQECDSVYLDNIQIFFNYFQTDFNIHFEETNFELIPDRTNYLIFNTDYYKLIQLHFHTPSEHTLNGEYTLLSLHLVHQNLNGELLVVNLFIIEGQCNKEFKSLIRILEKEDYDKSITLNLQNLISDEFYYYIGSTTTPPCYPNVKWVIIKESIEFSDKQIDVITSSIQDLNNGFNNNRPIQSLNNREIFKNFN